MRIWVARPEPGATRTAARLVGLRHLPVVAPVLTVRPTGKPLPGGPFDALVLTSAQGVRALAAAGSSTLHDLPVFAVGSRTAGLAAVAGFTRVLEADADAAGLAAHVCAALPPSGRVLHVAGADRKPEPAASLEAAGYQIALHVAYAAEAVPVLPPAAAAALSTGELDAVLHYSRRSAEVAQHLAHSAGYGGAFSRLRHYCLSADVAVPLEGAGLVAHFVAARPTEDELLAGVVTEL